MATASPLPHHLPSATEISKTLIRTKSALPKTLSKSLAMNFQIPPHVEPTPCPEDGCEEKFYTTRMLNLHVRMIHLQIPCHHCPICSSLFGHAKDLNEHINKSHDRKKMPVSCPECQCRFLTKFHLRQHIQKTHRNKMIKCRECEYECEHVGTMERHELDVHHLKPAKPVPQEKELTLSERAERTVGYIVVPSDV